MSLKELSKISRVSFNTISFYERNKVDPPIGKLSRIAEALGLTIIDLLYDTPEFPFTNE